MEEIAGLSTYKAVAELNRRGIKSALGGEWHPETIMRLRQRLGLKRRS